MANAAVYFMHMGQPALLYLVPCCLGTMVVLGYRRSELLQLWQGPTVLQVADVITYGKRPTDATNGDTAMMGSGDEGGGGGNGSTFSSAAVTSSSLEPLDGSSGIMVELSFQQQQQQQPMEEDDEMGRTPLLVSASASPSLGGGKNPNQS
jgi:Signal peptide peptidase